MRGNESFPSSSHFTQKFCTEKGYINSDFSLKYIQSCTEKFIGFCFATERIFVNGNLKRRMKLKVIVQCRNYYISLSAYRVMECYYSMLYLLMSVYTSTKTLALQNTKEMPTINRTMKNR